MFKTIVGRDPEINKEQRSYNIDYDKVQILLDQEPFDWDVIETGQDYFHILKDNQSYKAELIEADYDSKLLAIKVNGKIFRIKIKDRFDLLLEKLGMSAVNSSKINDIKAPMPGLILEIQVKEGEEVKKGDTIMILEAMKMENVLKSPGDGIVKNIQVKKGDSVEKNQVLIQF